MSLQHLPSVIGVNYLIQSAFSSGFQVSHLQTSSCKMVQLQQGAVMLPRILWNNMICEQNYPDNISQGYFSLFTFLPDNVNSGDCVEFCSANLEKMRKAVLFLNKNPLTEIWLHWVPYYTVESIKDEVRNLKMYVIWAPLYNSLNRMR